MGLSGFTWVYPGWLDRKGLQVKNRVENFTKDYKYRVTTIASHEKRRESAYQMLPELIIEEVKKHPDVECVEVTEFKT